METTIIPVINPVDLPSEHLEALICEGAANLTSAEYEWLLAVAEFDRRRAWEAWGLPSCAHWLAWQVSLDLRAAREKVRVAGALAGLPLVSAEMAAGRLSFSKVRAITRIANPRNEADLVSIALGATSNQVERIVTGYRRATRGLDDPRDDQRQWRERSFHHHTNDDGSITITMRLPGTEGAQFVGAVERFVSPPTADDPARDPLSARRADAAVAMAIQSLATTDGTAPRPVVSVHADLDALLAEMAGRHGHAHDADDVGGCTVGTIDGGLSSPVGISRAAALRMLCDCDVETVVTRDGRPIGISTRSQIVRGRARRLVLQRDHHRCRFPGCTRPIGLDVHHITHRRRKGDNRLTNLLTLCRFHHHQLHEGGWTITHTANGLEFHSPDGRTLTEHPPTTNGDPAKVRRHRRTANDGRCGWLGDRLDLGLATELLLWHERDPWNATPHPETS